MTKFDSRGLGLLLFAFLGQFFFSNIALATKTSFHISHPVGWMYDLPPGETPGWSAPLWVNFELSHASIWNVDAQFKDLRTNDIYNYQATFEQSNAILDWGFALSKSWAFGMEIPYAYRSGGVFGEFVKQFHWAIGSETFERPDYPQYQNVYSIKSNGTDVFDTNHGEGVSNLKFKLKWWPIKWTGDDQGSCDCGIAFSMQVKFPTQPWNLGGMTSGSTDVSGLAMLGFPIFRHSGIWFTSAVTETGTNYPMQAWPVRSWHQMYEMSTDLAVSDSIGIILQMRANSPILNSEEIDFWDPNAKTNFQYIEDRVASAYNDLIGWTGAQVIGIRYRWGEGSEFNFLFMEDWWFGGYDDSRDPLYSTNGPDFMFITQFHFLF